MNTIFSLINPPSVSFSQENFEKLLRENLDLKKKIEDAYHLKHFYQDKYIAAMEKLQEKQWVETDHLKVAG
jgi:hypothetical protein